MKFLQEKALIVCGILLVILPLTGFPMLWKTIFMVLIGIVIIYIGALQFKIARVQEKSFNLETKTETFTETI